MKTIVTTPLIQLEHLDHDCARRHEEITVVEVTLAGMRPMREAHAKGQPWCECGGRILVLIEDPFGVIAEATFRAPLAYTGEDDGSAK